MVRTQIQLTEAQVAQLKELAHESNQSMAALIREALDQFLAQRHLERDALHRQALSVVGKYSASVPDISVHHDRYLDEAYGA